VDDIYSEGTSDWGEIFTPKEYRVNLDLVRKTTNYDILSMWDFLNILSCKHMEVWLYYQVDGHLMKPLKIE
jgi:hypothetical protein